MGYQESFIHTTCSNVERNNEDIQKYIELFKKYDVRCEGDWLASCITKLHFNKTVNKFKKGMDVLVISGERQAQRSANRLFDIDYELDEDMIPKYTKEELKLIRRARITFIEEAFDVLEAEKDGHSIDIEEISLIPELPSNYNKVEDMFKGMLNNIISYLNENGNQDIKTTKDLLYKYYPKNEQEVKDVIAIIKKFIESNGYNFECKEKKEAVNTFKGTFTRTDYEFYINDINFGDICHLPWQEEYLVGLYEITGQNLRVICRKLLGQESQIKQ